MHLAELSMRSPQKITLHAPTIFRVNGKITVAKFPEYGDRAQVPACPSERRISIHILRINCCASIQKKLDGFFSAKGGCAMKRSFCFRSAVSHEATRFC